MKEGQIGIIIEWNGELYIGSIVQRSFGNEMFGIGTNQSWPNVHEYDERFKVMILPEGSELTVTDNQ